PSAVDRVAATAGGSTAPGDDRVGDGREMRVTFGPAVEVVCQVDEDQVVVGIGPANTTIAAVVAKAARTAERAERAYAVRARPRPSELEAVRPAQRQPGAPIHFAIRRGFTGLHEDRRAQELCISISATPHEHQIELRKVSGRCRDAGGGNDRLANEFP